ncbi:Biotin biosynthesis protein BioH [Legionella wadsworthii]|uniref:Biotin biosynthesis protein BioH n=2 Tax=Legionella wadsworthii TaxID=28088 RepID=A0A378LU48_9GAMM|nr:Biotin biosynthesis protein BioH [Legionella wadsworthii]
MSYSKSYTKFMNVNIRSYGEGFPIVFFHGWGFDSTIWLSLIPKLALNFQLILVDLPGFGHTPTMDWFLFKELLLTELPPKFGVVGWSMGGLYGLRLATEESSRVDYLVNVTSSPCFLHTDIWPGVPKEVFKGFYNKLSREPHNTLKDFLELNGLNTKEALRFLPVKLPSLEGLELGLNILETWDLRQKLEYFNKPICFMFGRLDPIVPVKTMKSMQMYYPKFDYVLFKRSGHLPFLSQMDLFIECLQGFIK